jgi:hypothetical protein
MTLALQNINARLAKLQATLWAEAKKLTDEQFAALPLAKSYLVNPSHVPMSRKSFQRSMKTEKTSNHQKSLFEGPTIGMINASGDARVLPPRPIAGHLIDRASFQEDDNVQLSKVRLSTAQPFRIAPRHSLHDLIFECHAFGVIFLEPCLRGVAFANTLR